MINHINAKTKFNLINFGTMILLLCFFVTFMCFTFKEDEEVTMGFMEHSFHSIVNIDSLDVHPPLYYLLLKTFLIIFTFWTKSLFIKTIFARIFSLICFLLVFYVLKRIAILSKVNLTKRLNFIAFCLFCFMPSVLEVATHLRMYELVTLFIVIEYYKLIEFNKDGKLINLVVATLFAILSAYTHYFIAIIAGLLLIVFCFKELKTNHLKQFLDIIVSGFMLIILYLPMMPYVISQFVNRSKFPQSSSNIYDPTISSFVQLTAAGSKIKDLFDLILFLSLIVTTFVLIKINHNQLLIKRIHDIGICVIIATVIELIISISYSNFYECRFIFPLVLMYFYFLILLFVDTINKYKIHIFKLVSNIGILSFLICISFIGLSDCNKLNQNIKQYDIPSITLVNNINDHKQSSNRDVNVTLKHYPTQFQEALYATQSAVYLKTIGKNAVVYHPNTTNIYSECNSNKKFVNKLFTNLRIK